MTDAVCSNGEKSGASSVTIDVYTTTDPTKPFTHRWRREGGALHGETNDIELPEGSGPHTLTFILHDDAKPPLGVKFKPTVDEAFWVHEGSDCPTTQSSHHQIPHGSVTDTTLTVHNKNDGNACDLHYMLRFDPDPYVLDPVIRNGGGPRQT